MSERPYTRRGVLAVVNSIYDPIGFLVPITLKGKLLLRKLVALGKEKQHNAALLGWDDPFPSNFNQEWQRWKGSLALLKNVSIPRCYHVKEFQLARSEVHAFSDASEEAIATVVYLKQVSCEGNQSVIRLRSNETFPEAFDHRASFRVMCSCLVDSSC